MRLVLGRRPIVVALAGSNGAGKTTFYHAHLQPAGLRFVNADLIAQELDLELYPQLGSPIPFAASWFARARVSYLKPSSPILWAINLRS